jgi:hypothetical protein
VSLTLQKSHCPLIMAVKFEKKISHFCKRMLGIAREWNFLDPRPNQNYALATLEVFSCLIRNEQ